MANVWLVHDTDLMRRLTPADREVLQRVCPYRTYRKGEALYRRGERATYLHIVVEGYVQLVVPAPGLQEQVLATVGPHSFAGELFTQEHARYTADAVAISDRVVSCPVSREDYLQLAFRAPHFVLSFTEVLASHLANCHAQLGLTALPLKARVIYALLAEAQRSGQPGEAGWVHLNREFKQEELAAQVSSARVSVTRVMSELRSAGLVTGQRGRYRVNLEGLEAAGRQASRK